MGLRLHSGVTAHVALAAIAAAATLAFLFIGDDLPYDTAYDEQYNAANNICCHVFLLKQ